MDDQHISLMEIKLLARKNSDLASESVEPATRCAVHSRAGRGSYAKELRALGQALEARHIATLDLVAVADIYAVRGRVRIPKEVAPPGFRISFIMHSFWSLISGDFPVCPETQTIDLRYTVDEIMQFDELGRSKRNRPDGTPNPNALSHILRSAGSYVDFKERSSLIGVSVEDRWVTIRYQTADGYPQETKQDVEYFYDYWVNMYLRRSNRQGVTPPYRPFLANWQQLKKLYGL